MTPTQPFENVMLRQNLFSELILLGADVKQIASMDPSTEGLTDLVTGIRKIQKFIRDPDFEEYLINELKDLR